MCDSSQGAPPAANASRSNACQQACMSMCAISKWHSDIEHGLVSTAALHDMVAVSFSTVMRHLVFEMALNVSGKRLAHKTTPFKGLEISVHLTFMCRCTKHCCPSHTVAGRSRASWTSKCGAPTQQQLLAFTPCQYLSS